MRNKMEITYTNKIIKMTGEEILERGKASIENAENIQTKEILQPTK